MSWEDWKELEYHTKLCPSVQFYSQMVLSEFVVTKKITINPALDVPEYPLPSAEDSFVQLNCDKKVL